MGDRYWNGEGVDEDLAEAVKWYTVAAEYGDAEIQYLLGDCYRYGKGVAKDLKEAKKWFSCAAYQGDDCAKDVLLQLGDEDRLKDR
jgi:TPR repeat protein